MARVPKKMHGGGVYDPVKDAPLVLDRQALAKKILLKHFEGDASKFQIARGGDVEMCVIVVVDRCDVDAVRAALPVDEHPIQFLVEENTTFHYAVGKSRWC